MTIVGASEVPAPIRDYFRLLNAEQWREFDLLWTPAAELKAVGTKPRRGRADVLEYFHGLFALWPEHNDRPTRVLVAGNSVTVEVSFEGTTDKGKSISFDAVDLFDLEEERISRLSSWYDLAILRQLLATP